MIVEWLFPMHIDEKLAGLQLTGLPEHR